MGITDTLLNSRNDPDVIEFRQKKVAASNLLADYKNNSFFRKITKMPPIGLREYTIDFWPSDLGIIPDSEDECWSLVLKYTR